MATANHTCVYMNCKNSLKNRRDLSYFKFPIKNLKRCGEWKKNCGNILIADMDNEALGHKLICEEHFITADILCNSVRKVLNKSATPKNFTDPAEDLPQDTISCFPVAGTSGFGALKTYAVKRQLTSANGEDPAPFRIRKLEDDPFAKQWDSDSSASVVSTRILNMPSPKTGKVLSPNCRKLKSKLRVLHKIIKAKTIQNSRLKSKQRKFCTKHIVEKSLLNKSRAVKNFTNMQLFHRRNTSWTYNEKQLALSLYYKSPGSYKFMGNKLGFVLPSVRTVQSWLKIANLVTGVKTNLTKKLAIKVSTMAESEKRCVVMFDEITLKKKLEYNKLQDIIEGYEDLGHLGRNDKIANTAMVFYLRGLLHNWKIPFCYYISSGPIKGDVLKELITTVLNELINISLKPMILVCDQGTNNRSALSKLGATQESPIIYINAIKIFTCFDPPHLLKSLRNNFMNPKLNFLIRKKPVSWSDIVRTYEIDTNSKTSRALTKITPIHINPNTFQKMRVKLAAQIFSHSVASAVKTVVKSNELKSSSGENTADFVQIINNIFDSINSRILQDPNPNRRPLSIFKNTSLQNLQNGLEYFKNIEVYSDGKRRNNIYCINGFMWSIRSILLLWDDLKNEGVKYLLTGFINQDALENFNSVIRNRGGYNPMPSVRQFRISTQHNMFIKLQMGVDSANCQDDEAEILELNKEPLESQIDPFPKNEVNISASTSNSSKSNQQFELNDAEPSIPLQPSTSKECVNLESCSTVYLAGYLAFKLLKKYDCGICKDKLVKSEGDLFSENEFYLLCKDYGTEQITYLKRPSDCFVDFVSKLLLLFNSSFTIHKCSKHVAKNIITDLTSESEQLIERFCSKHVKDSINLLIKVKIYRTLKNESEHIELIRLNSSKLRKEHRKVKILS